MKSKENNTELDKYEKDLEAHFEQSKALSGSEKIEIMGKLKTAASNYMKKDKRITIRVYGSDLERIKKLAMEEGLPYQTYITSFLHKLSTGRVQSGNA